MRGKKSGAPAEEFSLISNETLLALHRKLLICRARTSRIKPSRRGARNAAEYDAVVVAVTNGLVRDDLVRSKARAEMIEALRGRSHAASRKSQPAGENLAAMLHGALGTALANKTGKTGKVTLVFGGDGNEATWRAALETARVHSLPIIFLSTIDLAMERRDHAQVKSKLQPGTELPQITVDGNDVVAVYRVAHEAIARARRDRGPTLIECAESRLRGRWNNDPVASMEAYLKAKGLLPVASNRKAARTQSLQRRAR